MAVESTKDKEKILINDIKVSSEENLYRKYGTVYFQKIKNYTSAKFVQLAENSIDSTLFDDVITKWQIQYPRLLISINGNYKVKDVNDQLKSSIILGLQKITKIPGTWVITNGLSKGLKRDISNLTAGLSTCIIGVSSTNDIRNIDQLSVESGCNKTLYKIDSTNEVGKNYLDPNHTHFMLLNTSKEKEKSKEEVAEFRRNFESNVARKMNIPAYCIITLGGDLGTLTNIYETCKTNTATSVILVGGTKGITDILVYAIDNAEEITLSGYHSGILIDMFKDAFPDASPSYEELVQQIINVMEYKEKFITFKAEKETSFDEDILTSIILNLPNEIGNRQFEDINEEEVKIYRQIILCLFWDRFDLFKEINLDGLLKNEYFNNALIMALALNRVDFVRFLLNEKVDVYPTISYLNMSFLYGYRSLQDESFLKYELDKSSYSSSKQMMRSRTFIHPDETEKEVLTNDDHVFQILCKYGNFDMDIFISYKIIKRVFRKYCNKFKSMNNDTYRDFVRHHCRLQYTEVPTNHYYILFTWAVLNNMHQMALLFWEFGEDCLPNAIIAREMNIAISKTAKKMTANIISNEYYENAMDFQKIAMEVLEELHQLGKDDSRTILTRDACLTTVAHDSCETSITLAHASHFQEFVAHSSVQGILNEMWEGEINLNINNRFQILLALMFPLFILKLSFKTGNKSNNVEIQTPKDEYQINNGEDEINQTDRQSLLEYGTFENKPSSKGMIDYMWYQKLIIFYFKTPIVKFYINLIAYLTFLCVFTYVALLKKITNQLELTEYILIFFVISLTAEELNQLFHYNDSIVRSLSLYFSSFWNIMDVLAIGLFYIGIGLRTNVKTFELGHLFFAVDAWFWILRILHVFYAHPVLGPYIVMIGKMFRDMAYFVFVLAVFVIAYGVSNNSILQPPETTEATSTVRDILRAYYDMNGKSGEDASESGTRFTTPEVNTYAKSASWLIHGVYMMTSNLLLMNMLIAKFGNTYAEVEENSDLIWKYERYALIEEYRNRPNLAPPFMLFEHIYKLIKWIASKVVGKCKKDQTPLNKKRIDMFDEIELNRFETKVISQVLYKINQAYCYT